MRIPSKASRGFTLLEILIVIAILAILALLGWIALSAIQNSAKRKTAENEIAALSAAMQACRADNGNVLPHGSGNVTSSNVMYRALYRDSKNKGRPDTVNGAQLKPYYELMPMEHKKGKGHQESGLGIPVIRKSGKYYIMDPWGEPYRYRLGYDTEGPDGKVGDGYNADFDIFSLGPDGKGNGRNNRGDNEDNVSNVKSWK